MNKILYCSCLLYYSSYLPVFTQDTVVVSKEMLNFDASYVGDNVNNLSGGLRTGSCYLGMANFRASLNTEKAGLWKGGHFFINAANTHGAEPSGQLIGDSQVVSNIEAGNHAFVQELWYSQVIGQFEITAGLQDLNVEFGNSERGSLYLNSSFGILPTISCNIPAPVFPLTSLGLSLKWELSEKISWLVAVYDGCPTGFEDNPYNLRWELNSGDGALGISEIQYATRVNNMPGIIKGGIYSHYHYLEVHDETNQPEPRYETNYGFYAIADQLIWSGHRNNRSLGLFFQLGLSPEELSCNYYYTGIGLNYHGLLNKQGEDVLGVAVAHAGLKRKAGNETTLELTYKIPFTPHIFLQPDIQYIINPAGSDEELDNCVAAIIRFRINF